MKHFKQIMLLFVLVFLILPGVAFSAMSNMTSVLPIVDAVTFYTVNVNHEYQTDSGLNRIDTFAVVVQPTLNPFNEKMYAVNNDTGHAKINPAVIGQMGLVSLIKKAEFQNTMGAPRKILTADSDKSVNDSNGVLSSVNMNSFGRVCNAELVLIADNMNFQQGCRDNSNLGAPRKILITADNYKRSLNAVQYNQMGYVA